MGYNEAGRSYLWAVDALVCLIFFLDVLAAFNTAFVEETAKGTSYVFDRRLIADRYARGFLLPDLASSLPLVVGERGRRAPGTDSLACFGQLYAYRTSARPRAS